MKLNIIERLFILSPIRRFLQRRLEARQLLALGGLVPGAHALETGCGPGGGISLIYEQFGAARVDAFDMDPAMVAHARRRLHNRRTAVWVGNLRHIPVSAKQYDAVFNFGAIHHVVEWRAAVREIYRVLKPGGRFYCEEILSRYITHPLIGRLMDHPQTDRFDETEFIASMQQTGFHILNSRQMADLYLWVVADKAGTTS